MRNKFSLIIILITALLLIVGVFFSDGVDSIKEAFKSIEPKYFLIMISTMILYWLSQAMINMELAHNQGQRISPLQSIKTYMIGEFFSAITPMSTGGQPAQAIYMTSIGIPAGIASSILGIQLFFYHIARLILAFGLTFMHYEFFYNSGYAFTIFLIIGLVLNSALAFFMLLAALRPNLIKKLVNKIFQLLEKLKILKNVENKAEERREKLNRGVDDFYNSIRQFGGQKPSLFLLIIMQNIISLIYFYGVTHYIFMSFGLELPNIWMSLACVCTVQMISAYVPLPGGSFGAEGIFYLMFSQILPKGAPIFLILLIWRLLTYYFTIIASFPFTLTIKNKNSKGGNNEKD